MSLDRRREDRRTSRTRQSAGQALIDLILEKDFEAIRVQDVLDRAGVARSTFYAHYRTKEDLLSSLFEDFLHRFDRYTARRRTETRIVPITEWFDHLKDFHPVYRALARSRKLDVFFRMALTVLSRQLEAQLTTQVSKAARRTVPTPIVAHHLAGAFLTMLRWWLDHNMPLPPARMEQIFQNLVMPGVRDLLVAGAPALQDRRDPRKDLRV